MTEITLKTGKGKPAKADLVEGEFALDVGNGTIYSKLESGDVTALNTAEFIGVNTDADNYQYWQYKVDGFGTTNVMSTQALDFQAGDGVEIVKKGSGIEISATGGGSGTGGLVRPPNFGSRNDRAAIVSGTARSPAAPGPGLTCFDAGDGRASALVCDETAFFGAPTGCGAVIGAFCSPGDVGAVVGV